MTHLYVIEILISILVSYLLGSIPNAIIIGKGIYGVDVRDFGSGNTGSTNVLRVLGVKPGLIVFVLDVVKGAIAVILSYLIAHYMEITFIGSAWQGQTPLSSGWTYELIGVVAALAAVAGHLFSPFLGFKGGKGVACGLGGLLATIPVPGLCAFAVFIIVVLITRYASLGSVSAGISLPIFVLIFFPGSIVYLIYGLAIMLTLLYTHRTNLVRLAHHEERKFSIGKHPKGGEEADTHEPGTDDDPNEGGAR